MTSVRSPQRRRGKYSRRARRRIRSVLLGWDLLGERVPRDEYDCMVVPVLDQLSAGADADGLTAWLTAHVPEHFELPSVAAREHALACALVDAWSDLS